MPDAPVTVAVISDSHVNNIAELPSKVLEALAKADAVIHLGDFTSPDLLSELRKFTRFCGVIGNHDSLIGRQKLNVVEILELGGKRLGLIHGLFLPMARPKRMVAWLRKYNIDILLCGHSHLAASRTLNGVFLFNPGTVTGQFPATQASFGILTLNGDIKSEIIHLQDMQPKDYLHKIMASVIRSGIRFFEAWPYIDIRFILKNINRTWRNRFSP
jgi:uncharacterized protein